MAAYNEDSLLALVGPTASGKGEIAQRIADETGATLVSVDSRKIYRGMDIGTAKPSKEAAARYDYAFIDIRDPNESYSAGEFARDARDLVQARLANGQKVILVGGTGFYLEAFINGLADLPAVDPKIRQAVLDQADSDGWPAIHARLSVADPDWAKRIAPNDRTRLLRAAEILAQTGIPLSQWQGLLTPKPCPWRVLAVMVELPVAELNARIAARTDRMIEAGLVEEVRGLLASGYDADSPGMATVGYQEAMAHLEVSLPLDQMREEIVIHTRQYAKRQRTWFRGRPYVRAIRCKTTAWREIALLWRGH